MNNISIPAEGRRKRARSIRKNRDEGNGLDFKEAKDLQEDYETLLRAIASEEIDLFSDIIRSSDMKYFLVHNDLDYNLFRDSVRFQRLEFISELEKGGYKFNNNMLLIELYENYIIKKLKEKLKEEELSTYFTKEDFMFLILYENGKLIDTEQSLLEFYFLLLSTEYDLANTLLAQSYSFDIKEIINQMFIGDENNLLEHIVMNGEIIKGALKCALQRQLDGIA
jgi:hypothetical protein